MAKVYSIAAFTLWMVLHTMASAYKQRVWDWESHKWDYDYTPTYGRNTGKGWMYVLTMIDCPLGAENQECRGHPHLKMLPQECCNVNLKQEQVECIKKISEKWIERRKSSDKENADMSDVGCASDCFFSTDIAAPENKINADEAKANLDNILGADWQSMIPNIIETCKARAENGSGRKRHIGNCNVTKEKFVMCIHEQVLEFCPDSAWKNEDKCNDARTFLKKCPFEKRFGKRGQNDQKQEKEEA